VQQAAARTGVPKQARPGVAPQKRSRVFVTTKKGVCYLTVKSGQVHFQILRIGFFGESEKFRALACPTSRQASTLPPSLGRS
jgi:hypothetical protein